MAGYVSRKQKTEGANNYIIFAEILRLNTKLPKKSLTIELFQIMFDSSTVT